MGFHLHRAIRLMLFAPSYSTDAIKTGTVVAENAEYKKIAKYIDLERDFIFTPDAVETLGGHGPLTQTFLKDLGRRLRHSINDGKAEAYLRQRIGIAVQIGNAAFFTTSKAVTHSLKNFNEIVYY